MKETIGDKKQICPVCGKELFDHVPDMKSVLAELFYNGKSVRIVTPEVVIEADFDHALDEEGLSLDEPHPLVAVIKIRFDSSGKGTSYEVLQIFEGVELCQSIFERRFYYKSRYDGKATEENGGNAFVVLSD